MLGEAELIPTLKLSDGSLTKLTPHLYRREDEADDEMFYAVPRLVTHIDDEACAALTSYYKKMLVPGTSVLDLMSSCVSHLPTDASYTQVVGVGMNRTELQENPQLTSCVVHNLNRNPDLPFEEKSFDACTLSVSIQYLVRPVEVFRDVGRILKPGAPMIVSYSNRLFPTKAVMIWKMLNDADHGRLVAHYFESSGHFDSSEIKRVTDDKGSSDPLYVVVARAAKGSISS